MQLRFIAIHDSDSSALISQRRIRVVDRVLELPGGVDFRTRAESSAPRPCACFARACTPTRQA